MSFNPTRFLNAIPVEQRGYILDLCSTFFDILLRGMLRVPIITSRLASLFAVPGSNQSARPLSLAYRHCVAVTNADALRTSRGALNYRGAVFPTQYGCGCDLGNVRWYSCRLFFSPDRVPGAAVAGCRCPGNIGFDSYWRR